MPKRNQPSEQDGINLNLLYPDRYDCDEDLEQSDFPGLNLGTESLAATPKYGSLARQRSLDSQRLKKAKAKQITVDRECIICFDLAMRPSRTRCCGKLFCEDHLHDWLSRSSNRCPSCGTYCDPETGVVSLAAPTSPTWLSQHTSHTTTTTLRKRNSFDYDVEHDNLDAKASSTRSSSSSSNHSVDPSTDQDGENTHISADELSHVRSICTKLIRHFLDDPLLAVPEVYAFEHPETSSQLVELDSPTVPPSSQSPEIQMFLTPAYRSSGSAVVNDDEMVFVALASKVAGKVLSIIALILVFWLLVSS